MSRRAQTRIRLRPKRHRNPRLNATVLQEIPVTEMFNTIHKKKRSRSFGIDDYNPPKKYIDHRQEAWKKQRATNEYQQVVTKGVQRYDKGKSNGHIKFMDFMKKSKTVEFAHNKDKRKVMPGPGTYLPTKTHKELQKEKGKPQAWKMNPLHIRKDHLWHIEHDAALGEKYTPTFSPNIQASGEKNQARPRTSKSWPPRTNDSPIWRKTSNWKRPRKKVFPDF
jgi:hypothetical protein